MAVAVVVVLVVNITVVFIVARTTTLATAILFWVIRRVYRGSSICQGRWLFVNIIRRLWQIYRYIQ